VLLGSGFALARLTAPAPVDAARLRADLTRELRQEVATQLTQYGSEQRSRQDEFQQAVVEAISRIETRQLAEHASLRKDVETVAVQTQEEFERMASARGVGELTNPR